MAHEVTKKDTGWMFHKPAWHRLFEVGKKRPKSIAAARKASGLTWDVQSVPFITLPTLEQLAKTIESASTSKAAIRHLVNRASEHAAPYNRAIVRDDTLDVLGTWSHEGVPITNREGFEFMEAVLGGTLFEALFSFGGGRYVCLLSEFPDHITVGGDAVRRFLYTKLDHTGSGAMQTMATNVRVQCANTDRMALNEARARDGIYRVRHIGNTSERIAEARAALELTVDYAKQFKKFGDRLARQKIAERKVEKVLAELYPASSQTDRAVKNADKRRELVAAIFRGDTSHPLVKGDTTGNAPGTKWCLYNAVVEHDQHYRRVHTKDAAKAGERLFVRAMTDPDGVQARALNLLVSA
jgi:phage/plasmid-like protein (TIGR03299 family)